mmetsp:Transcript_12551/g.34818  ORF Transcript_12551/g.34818 Transcript_12551/m.34818 type:complete len:519 (+) Transcript_12551:218-1774(+)|eukprot:CAMPEP_0168739520 /NCGR_PEP_ID=MMETSP0724-20121128/11506_1 /TAXON_ID=265536 /ORGANISM="Amphiprora sp., Strain CCMP467" /LENGTH=518 /DNA_ID=CAMNT_0008786927 /DNA_START=158 /DNA_END=1714 /DNA_ORIENTATION=+
MTDSNNNNKDDPFSYLHGFGNEFESECLEGALPQGRNNPKQPPYHLYTEQLSGTAFTKPRTAGNRRVWLYRLQPSVTALSQRPLEPVVKNNDGRKEPVYFGHTPPTDCEPQVNALRWHPRPSIINDSNDNKNESITFIEGCQLMCHGGSSAQKQGVAMYLWECNTSMTHSSLSNADGEFLLVPQRGTIRVVTELGMLQVAPQEIIVIPRGIHFSVHLVKEDGDEDATTTTTTSHRGYMLEVYGGDGFQLPELGPIGSNGLANARDFCHPVAATYGQTNKNNNMTPFQMYAKMQSQLFVQPTASSDSGPSSLSPYNVVAWHGNYLPYKYDLQKFCTVNSVSYDHLDPSIYTVLTCPSSTLQGTALTDFVIFPPRYMATDENTFRPPWFHRNTMSEYMGLIVGQYDAKPNGAFLPGGASLHNCMVPHGPDAVAVQKATADPCTEPTYFDKGLAFMFETYLPLTVAPVALTDVEWLDVNYAPSSWKSLTVSGQFSAWEALVQVEQEAQEKLTRRKAASETK